MFRVIVIILLSATIVRAEGERAGDFDYYVLSLSWNPSWCSLEGDDRNADQCDERHDLGFTLHGLWPQYEDGWPSFCRTTQRDPSRAETNAMADIMGSGGLAWHQWKKHGRCSGASSRAYFDASRAAYDRIVRPEIFHRLPEEIRLDPSVIEAAFIEANPDLAPDGVTVTCKQGAVQEVRICLNRHLEPRDCGPDVVRDCPAATIRMAPVR